jgi:hypothetical protein
MKNTSKGRSKKKIRSFIYLDEYKMYSISSQVFEGLTEYVTSYSQKSNQDLESQEGPIGSGRILADIISKQASTEERKFLHDYSYNLFEEKLLDDQRVLEVELSNIDKVIGKLENYDFVKVRGRLLFSDIKLINDTIENINRLGEAFVYLTNYSSINELKQQYGTTSQPKNRNDKAFSKQSTKQTNDLSSIAKQLGWNIDQEFLERLAFVLNYGYRDQFEVKAYLPTSEDKYLFSALLKRNYLREEEHLIVSKYSRYSEKDFIIFGTVTQSKDSQGDLPIEEDTNPNDIKELLAQLIMKLSDVEKQFTGKRANEIMIDPIAIYREF